MKKLLGIIFLLPVFGGCEEMESMNQWNRTEAQIAEHGDFDATAVQELLTGGVAWIYDMFDLSKKSLVYGVHVDTLGGGDPEFLFFEDGTTWDCWQDQSLTYGGGRFYKIDYQWRYDPQTRTLTTWSDYVEKQAVVRAIDGDTMILDGRIFDDREDYRLVLSFDRNPERRSKILNTYRNVANAEKIL